MKRNQIKRVSTLATFALLCASLNLLAADFSGAGIAGKLTFVSPKSHNGVPGFGGNLLFEWDLGEAGFFQYAPSADVWIAKVAREESYTGEFFVSPVEVNYWFPVPDEFRLQAYVGAGMGNVASATRVTATSEWRDVEFFGFGMSLFGGIAIKALKVAVPFGELRINTGNYSAVKLSVGLQLRSFKRKKQTITTEQ